MRKHRRPKYPSVHYNVALCDVCQQAISFQQLREAVYWLPDMDHYEEVWMQYSGFEHKWMHLACWQALQEKRRELIKLCSYKNQEPRSMGRVL